MQRLQKELLLLSKAPPSGISVVQDNDANNKLEACISGPDDTPYEKGMFRLEILIPGQYPILPPLVRFVTKIYHPNIDDSGNNLTKTILAENRERKINIGRICLDLLKLPPGSWKPIITLEKLLVAIRMLLETPNADDPLMVDIGREFTADRKLFEKNARDYCVKYAMNQ